MDYENQNPKGNGDCCAQLRQLATAMQQDYNREALRNLVICAFSSDDAQALSKNELGSLAVMVHDLVALAYTAKIEASS